MRRRDIIVAAIAVALTLFAGLVALNFRTGEKQIEQKVARLYATRDAQFARAMGVLLGPPILEGNRFEVLVNGDRIFPSMLTAIRAATATISFESYIYWSGNVGKAFAEALAERARAGVKVTFCSTGWAATRSTRNSLR
jgi:cardiolipin synthase A/B